MPELFSRMDKLNWLTPSIADILDQGSTPPGGDGSIRGRMLTIQNELDEHETPAKIVNVRPTPSYTLYVARPEMIGKANNRRTASTNEIKQSLKKIADNHANWLLGFMPQLRQEDTAVGILLRTEEHRPVSLRRLLVRSTFRKHASTLAFVLGITLEQQLIVDSIDDIGNMLVIGNDNAKQHFIRSTLLTLIMLNTPSELRVAIAGESSEAYRYMVGAPHALGRILTSPSDGQRLIDGLVKEIQRRQQSMQDEGKSTLESYNRSASEQGKSALPRIILVLDSLTDETWQNKRDKWLDALETLLIEGNKVGIHLIVTADDEELLPLSSKLRKTLKLRIITRASSKDISTQIPDFHASLLRFVDAFVLGQSQSDPDEIIPIELCAISNGEIKNVVDYWRQMSRQRYQDMQVAKSSKQTGVTGVLTPPPELETQQVKPPTPPTPQKPSVATLARATHKLSTELSAVVVAEKSPPTQEYAKTTQPEEKSSVEIDTSNNTTDVQDETLVVAERTETQLETLDHANKGNMEHQIIRFEQAVALTAYLGWISRGALCDIFDISSETADSLIQELKNHQIVEDENYPVLRFIKLVQSSNGRYQKD